MEKIVKLGVAMDRVLEAVKRAPHHCVRVGALEVVGAQDVSRWSFKYLVRRENGRVAYGRRNAVDYLAGIASDTPVRIQVEEVGSAVVNDAGEHTATFHGQDEEGFGHYTLNFKL